MKKMLILSMAFHAMVAMTLLISPVPLGRTLFLPSVYQVNLVTLPSPLNPLKAEAEPSPESQTAPAPINPVKAEAEPSPESQTAPALPETVAEKPPKVDKPKVVAKRLPEPKQAPRKLAPKETITSTPGKIQPSAPKTPMGEGTSGSKEVIASVPSITAGVDVPDFKFSWYTDSIMRKIGSMWSPPAIEIGPGSKEVVISFILITTGKIKEVQVEKSSGNTFFDQAALRAVYMADPLPPLPKGFRDPDLKVHFSFIMSRNG